MDLNKLNPARETAAFDVEGTLTEGTAWEGVRDYLIERDEEDLYKAFQKKMTPRYLLFRLNLGDKQAFKMDWIAGVLGLLAGRSRDEIQELANFILDNRLWPQRREDVLAELARQKEAGRQIVLVSGQFQPFLDAFVDRVGADAGIGTPGEWDGDRFTGRMAAPFTVGERKVTLLEGALQAGKLAAAYGDTGPDEALLALSAAPAAVYPDAALLRAARRQGWRILDGR